VKRSVTAIAVVAAILGWAAVESSAMAAVPDANSAQFFGQSMSWISSDQGWMLGSGTCDQGNCTTVIGTTNGAKSWTRLARIPAPLGFEKVTGVSRMRFADALHGWAFEPSLWSTSDGGSTWTRERIPGAGRQVLALGGDADAVYVLVTRCHFEQLCKIPVSLWRTTPGSGTWTRISVTLPTFTGYNTAVISAFGSVAYVDLPTVDSTTPDVVEVTTDGSTWNSRPSPCDKSQPEYLSGFVAVSETNVAMLCQSDIGFGQAEKRAFWSTDTGQTTQSAGTLPIYGIANQIAATASGTIIDASSSIGSWIYRNANSTTWTTPIDLGDGGMGWNDPVFTSNQVGYVIHGPWANCCGGGPGELWQTKDGGVTWTTLTMAIDER
jgi:hypothetical protein